MAPPWSWCSASSVQAGSLCAVTFLVHAAGAPVEILMPSRLPPLSLLSRGSHSSFGGALDSADRLTSHTLGGPGPVQVAWPPWPAAAAIADRAADQVAATDPEMIAVAAVINQMQPADAWKTMLDRLPALEQRLYPFGRAVQRTHPPTGEGHGIASRDWSLACKAQGGGPMVAHWTNFQKTFTCRANATVFCPSSAEDVQKIVNGHADVRSTGLLHSWTPFTCPSETANHRAIVSTSNLREIGDIDEDNLTVRVSAGVSTRELMSSIGARGFVLASVPFWIDQTIGGAVSTNTHGSSLRHGETTLSAQVRGVHMVLANGSDITLRHGEDGDGDDEMNAVTPAVGKLGVVYALDMAVVPDYCKRGVSRRWVEEDFEQTFLGVAALSTQDALSILQPQGSTAWQMFWFPNLAELTGSRDEINPVQCNPGSANTIDSNLGDLSIPFMAMVPMIRRSFPQLYEFIELNVIENTMYCNGDCMASRSQVVPTAAIGEIAPFDSYDQYEYAVPVQKAASCFAALRGEILSRPGVRKMFLAAPILLRFVGRDEKLLSFANDGIHMLININLDVSHRTHELWECEAWEDAIALLEGATCSGRLHWGKTGWEEMQAEAAIAMYPGLSEFKRLRAEWDPDGKFVGGSPVFDPQVTTAALRGRCTGGTQCHSSERQATRCRCTVPTSGLFETPCSWASPIVE